MGDRELAEVCGEVLTVLAHGEVPVETLNFNVVDAPIDRNEHLVTFHGVLSVNDDTVRYPEERFKALAASVVQPFSGERLAVWRDRHQRRVWPMPPASD
jgi:hypothetical protein